MKTGSINHPQREPLIKIHRWQIEICDGNVTAGLLVGYFHLIQIGRLPRPALMDTAKATNGLMNCWHKSTVSGALLHLVDLKLLYQYKLTSREATEICFAKSPQRLTCGDFICEWCNSQTVVLHQHHYPITKKQGGKSTVEICANCHAEYHYLTATLFYKPSAKLLAVFAEHPLSLEEVGA